MQHAPGEEGHRAIDSVSTDDEAIGGVGIDDRGLLCDVQVCKGGRHEDILSGKPATQLVAGRDCPGGGGMCVFGERGGRGGGMAR